MQAMSGRCSFGKAFAKGGVRFFQDQRDFPHPNTHENDFGAVGKFDVRVLCSFLECFVLT